MTTFELKTFEEPQESFRIRDLSVLAYANGFTLWHCKSAVISDIFTRNYFSDAADMMAVGDIIMVSAKDGMKLVYVTHSDVDVVVV